MRLHQSFHCRLTKSFSVWFCETEFQQESNGAQKNGIVDGAEHLDLLKELDGVSLLFHNLMRQYSFKLDGSSKGRNPSLERENLQSDVLINSFRTHFQLNSTSKVYYLLYKGLKRI